jgi:hypothetical protein
VSLEELSQFLIALVPLRECFTLLLSDLVPVVPLSRIPGPCRFPVPTDAIPRHPCPFLAWPSRGYRRQPHPWALGDARWRSCNLMSRTRHKGLIPFGKIQVDSWAFERTADWWMFGWLPTWRDLLPRERTPDIRRSAAFPISSRPRTRPTPLRWNVVTVASTTDIWEFSAACLSFRHDCVGGEGKKGWLKEGRIRVSGNCVKCLLEKSSLVTTVKIFAVVHALFLPLPPGIHRIPPVSAIGCAYSRSQACEPQCDAYLQTRTTTTARLHSEFVPTPPTPVSSF